MVRKSILGATCACLAAATLNTNAAIITHGTLTTDDTTNYITDTMTGRQYLRFDTFNLSVADTIAATNAGGIYEEWTIATSEIADDFYAALVGTVYNPCQGASAYGALCGTVAGFTDGQFGQSYDSSVDQFWYLSTNISPNRAQQPFGLGEIFAEYARVRDYDDWSTSADYYGINDPSRPINALVYKDAPVVPIPAAVWLFGSGLIGLTGLARRKAHA